ncbi:NAD(+)/NADH kinase [Vulcanisaeta thermophila]|uniref:NAD(+)/NADH kinase n=1 Tax=Vulcanisaeta thermophila TaxID=867917 RepID=UPI000853A40D|nr:NAD(+)/NADH kinase [Vulcanisaeta thermophila]
MHKVGLIVNPVSGTDIRRATSTAGFVDIMQKARIVKSLLKGIEAVGVGEVLIMPDFYGIAAHALWDLPQLNLKWSFIDMKPKGDYTDTVNAVREMVKENVGSIVILGGDGTVRVASKVSGNTPLLPISTGTNNVIPYFIDGTLAGIIAAAVANGLVINAMYRLKRVLLIINGEVIDQALVDLGATLYPFKGARAVTNPNMVTEVFISLVKPLSIGLASIGAALKPNGLPNDRILHVVIGSRFNIKAILMPGYVTNVGIDKVEEIKLGVKVPISKAYTIELDGEREVEVFDGDYVEVMADEGGPVIIDVNKAIQELFLRQCFNCS